VQRHEEIQHDDLVQRQRLLHDDLAFDELAADLVELLREVLVRRHALPDRHRVDRMPSPLADHYPP
jgi:hypothetical protein